MRWLQRAALLGSLILSAPALAAAPAIEIANGPLAGAGYYDPHVCPGAAARLHTAPGLSLLAAPAPGQDGYLFASDFDMETWSGRLSRLALAQDGAGQLHSGAALWEAGAILTGMASAPQPAPQERRIYTMNPQRASATVPLQWAELAPEQRAALGRDPLSGAADALGETRLAFLRGERGGEIGQPGGVLRRRTSLLGDAINSAPVLVGAAPPDVQGAGYAEFFERSKARRPAVYLGANDGMLHAFDAADGHELFAYVPNALMPALNQLASPAYRHRPYVDGAAAAAAANIGGAWKTVLVAGMGGGAQGVFALDVSDPADFARGGGALWEFTDRHDAAIGNVMAAPQIAKFRTGSKGGAANYRYFAVVASGLNNYVDDGRFAANGAGALFLLALDKPAAAPWQRGVNYYKLTLPAGDAGAANALGPPALAVGGDGAVLHAYAGDLQGNLWRFDFGAAWPGSAPGQPLFVARDGAGLRQPITQQPRIAFAHGGGYLILFGSGQWLEAADSDPAGFRVQSFYALHDTPGAPAAAGGRAALAVRTLGGDGASGFVLAGAALAPAGPGWYVDFPQAASSGERSVSSALLSGATLFLNTLSPGSAPCAAVAVRSYRIDILSGLATDDEGSARSGALTGQFSGVEVRGAPVLLETALGVGQRNATGAATASMHYLVFNVGPGGVQQVFGGAGGAASLALPARRMSWREIANWRELHEAAK